jgi:hypothetical protein
LEGFMHANVLQIKLVKIMEEKIIEILQDCKNGISVEICKDALLNLCVVSQQRELLVAWEKRRYSLEEWKIVEKISIEFIDDWLSN